ncbi:MAG: inositol monophosphatase family protein [Rhodospirillales bacterium]|nr:inositol monophosphatase family protein [Rhodospirillales bacterium]
MNLDGFVAFAERLADEAATMLAARAHAAAKTKPDKSFVTETDLAIEKRLRDMIAAAYPDHGVLGEEFDSVTPDADHVWILDPIDGTAAYVVGMPVYGTLISLAHRGRPVLGVIHFPATSERWVGARGRATTLNGRPCQTRKGEALHDAIVSASNPDFFDVAAKRPLAALSACTAWRVYGGAALSYGRLAQGRTDLAIDAGLKIHDYAAFVPILEGAGGIITDWNGDALTIASGPRVLAAGDRRRHAAALRIVQEAL